MAKRIVVLYERILNVTVTVSTLNEMSYTLTITKNGKRWHSKRNETSSECYRKALTWLNMALKK